MGRKITVLSDSKLFRFILVSGAGWGIDFAIYTVLVKLFFQGVFIANCISSLLAITFVFFIATRKVFESNSGRLSLRSKYLLYIMYQIILILFISWLAAVLNRELSSFFHNFILIKENTELVSKVMITPVTMILNFIVMKYLVEKI